MDAKKPAAAAQRNDGNGINIDTLNSIVIESVDREDQNAEQNTINDVVMARLSNNGVDRAKADYSVQQDDTHAQAATGLEDTTSSVYENKRGSNETVAEEKKEPANETQTSTIDQKQQADSSCLPSFATALNSAACSQGTTQDPPDAVNKGTSSNESNPNVAVAALQQEESSSNTTRYDERVARKKRMLMREEERRKRAAAVNQETSRPPSSDRIAARERKMQMETSIMNNTDTDGQIGEDAPGDELAAAPASSSSDAAVSTMVKRTPSLTQQAVPGDELAAALARTSSDAAVSTTVKRTPSLTRKAAPGDELATSLVNNESAVTKTANKTALLPRIAAPGDARTNATTTSNVTTSVDGSFRSPAVKRTSDKPTAPNGAEFHDDGLEEMTPGAYAVQGRAFGQFPGSEEDALTPSDDAQVAAALSMNKTQEKNVDTISSTVNAAKKRGGSMEKALSPNNVHASTQSLNETTTLNSTEQHKEDVIRPYGRVRSEGRFKSSYADRLARKMGQLNGNAYSREEKKDTRTVHHDVEQDLGNSAVAGDALAAAKISDCPSEIASVARVAGKKAASFQGQGIANQNGITTKKASLWSNDKERDENAFCERPEVAGDALAAAKFSDCPPEITSVARAARNEAAISQGQGTGNQNGITTREASLWSNGKESDENALAQRPGAIAAPGRALGQFPDWARHRASQAQRGTWDSTKGMVDPDAIDECHSLTDGEEVQPVAVVVEQEDLEREVRQQMMEDAAEAQVVAVEDPKDAKRRRILRILFFVVLLGTVIGLSVGLAKRGNTPSELTDMPTYCPSVSPTATPRPTLETVVEDGVLRCSIGYYVGMEVDLCRAVAAALFGDPDRIETVVPPWSMAWETLANGTVDLSTAGTTHTMVRDVYEESGKVGFSFTAPFFYDGLAFGGVPKFVDCADKLDVVFGECRGVRICVSEATTTYDVVSDFLPDFNIRVVPYDRLHESFINGTCNVIAETKYGVSNLTMWEKGYRGAYATGENLFSKDPTAIVTRDRDPQWSDFVNWVLQALLAAEEQNITQDTASAFTTTTVFGDQFENMFVNAIKAVGNYGELYARHFEPFVPRQGINSLNTNGSGLIYSHPFGPIMNAAGPSPSKGSTLNSILERSQLRCGITSQVGFGELDPDTKEWKGLDADYCYALSASLFFEDSFDNLEFVVVPPTSDGFMALAEGKVDVLSGARLNIGTDVLEPTSGEGFTFSLPYFYGPRASRLNLAFGEAIALATRQDDPQWSAYVYWIVSSTFYAEENFITKESSEDMPTVNLFGPRFEHMFQSVISAVGNYGEMYDRNLNATIARGDFNLLNENPFGPQHHSLFVI